ncbi:MAG: hypothetical protein A3F68_09385 [Acidobacteria bacterium RIFCSPLOWO2_12_FULL_54_10]|nr:MAG: hypothetical protein A3F68_09385 [Acidobacteria bacterium RIFCSPLOWO2_12_FULL_54_10]
MNQIYYVKPIQNGRQVPVHEAQVPRQYVWMTVWAVVVFGAAFWLAWQRYQGVEEGYQLEALLQTKQQILEANRKLRLEEAFLGDPMRVETIARIELGMTTLSPRQIFRDGSMPNSEQAQTLARNERPTTSLPTTARNVALAVPH